MHMKFRTQSRCFWTKSDMVEQFQKRLADAENESQSLSLRSLPTQHIETIGILQTNTQVFQTSMGSFKCWACSDNGGVLATLHGHRAKFEKGQSKSPEKIQQHLLKDHTHESR